MSEVALAHKYSSEKYDQALSNVIDRWEQNSDSPIKYEEAAIGVGESTVSVALKFLSEIGLLDAPKAGHYNVPNAVVEYRNKVGGVQQQSKKDVEERIGDYPVYDEAKFLLKRDEYSLDELADEIAGSNRVAADQDEIGNVKRSLKILAELDFLELDEDGAVSTPEDLDTSESGPVTERTGEGSAEDTASRKPADSNAVTQPESDGSKRNKSKTESEPQIVVSIDISVDLAEIESDELREKLNVIESALNHAEQ